MSFQISNFIIGSVTIVAISLFIYFFFFSKEYFMKHKSENKAIMNNYLPDQIGIINVEEDELPFIDVERSVSLKYNPKRYNRNDKQKTNYKGNVHTKHLL